MSPTHFMLNLYLDSDLLAQTGMKNTQQKTKQTLVQVAIILSSAARPTNIHPVQMRQHLKGNMKGFPKVMRE